MRVIVHARIDRRQEVGRGELAHGHGFEHTLPGHVQLGVLHSRQPQAPYRGRSAEPRDARSWAGIPAPGRASSPVGFFLFLNAIPVFFAAATAGEARSAGLVPGQRRARPWPSRALAVAIASAGVVFRVQCILASLPQPESMGILPLSGIRSSRKNDELDEEVRNDASFAKDRWITFVRIGVVTVR